MTMEASDQERIGDRYDLRQVIGIGGMARVYLAHDRMLGRDVAVKMLNPALVADPVFVERFRREAQAAAALNHPNIVTIYDTGTTDDTYYIVMEYVHGPNLKEELRERGPLPEREALAIGAQIAAALEVAHAHDLIHRDIKSHNVLIGPGEHIKVTDFGIARAAGSSHLTATQTVMGSAHYLSPEQALHQPLDGRSDLYSLGVVLYEALTGQLPFTGDSLVAVAMKHVHEQPAPLRAVRPEISPQAEAIVMKALAKDPAQRFQSAGEMRAAFLRASAEPRGVPTEGTRPIAIPSPAASPTFVDRAPPPPSTPPSAMVMEPPPGYAPPARGRWLTVPLLTALLLLGIGGAIFAAQRNSGVSATATPASATRIAGANGTVASAPTMMPTARVVLSATASASTPVSPTAPAIVPTVAPTIAPTPTPLAPPTATPLPAPTATPVPPTPTPQPSAPTSAPANVVSADTPAGAVQRFYQLAAQHNFDAAAQLWSPRMKAAYPVDENLVGHFNPAKEVDVRIGQVQTTDAAGRATVAVDVTEVRTAEPFTRRYVGSWQLVRGPNGWLLDQPNLSPA